VEVSSAGDSKGSQPRVSAAVEAEAAEPVASVDDEEPNGGSDESTPEAPLAPGETRPRRRRGRRGGRRNRPGGPRGPRGPVAEGGP
jgi:hypothetical protein